MSLDNFKKIHHLIGLHIPIVKGCLEGKVNCSLEVLDILKNCQSSEHFRIDEICLHEKEVTLEKIKPCNSKLNISLKILESDSSLIFKDLNDMLNKRLSLHKGENIEDFYFWSFDQYVGSDFESTLKSKLKSLCLLIKGLADLAHYHDNKSETGKSSYIFVNESDISNGHPLVIETKITEEMLIEPLIDVSIFDDFSTSKLGNKNPNIGREKSIFRATLIEYIKSKSSHSGDEFSLLIQGWDDFITLFKRNFDTYISGFAFHKARKEVADAELSIASELSKIMGEIGGKVLGIPISMVAIIPIVNSKSIFESIIISLGLLISSIISSQVISNQQNQLNRVLHAKKIMFPPDESQNSKLPDFLEDLVKNASENLDINYFKLNITLWFFRIISWLPAILGVIAVVNLYGMELDVKATSAICIPSLLIVFTMKSKWAKKYFLGKTC